MTSFPASQTFAVLLVLGGAIALAAPPAVPMVASAPTTLAATSTPAVPTARGPRLDHCLVTVIQDVQVAAQEAGVLESIPVQEGGQVTAGSPLAKLDDRRAQLAKQAADLEYRAAYEKATDDIAVRYAIAAHDVAVAEHAEKEQANLRSAGAVTKAELRRLELVRQRSALEIDKSKLEQRLAVASAQVKGAEVKAADENLARRQILSPLDGEIIAILKQAGEWVNPGDAVVRIIRMDHLRVEGFLNASEYNPEELAGKPVTVEVERAKGQRVSLPGKVVWVNPQVQAGNKYRVRAEVENRQQNGQWLLRPGMTATLTIQVQ